MSDETVGLLHERMNLVLVAYRHMVGNCRASVDELESYVLDAHRIVDDAIVLHDSEDCTKPTAIRKIVSYGPVGRCNCSACNWAIDPFDAFCRRCGARFVGTTYSHKKWSDHG